MLGGQRRVFGRCDCVQLLCVESSEDGEVWNAGCSALSYRNNEYHHEFETNTHLIQRVCIY